ncbi:hypothetical protein GCM10018782_65710 [Streptomyces griseoaurantiacus]|nr:hypothetical protein GCM10018782_65710 [Streptomyces griseoaurantiacus]
MQRPDALSRLAGGVLDSRTDLIDACHLAHAPRSRPRPAGVASGAGAASTSTLVPPSGDASKIVSLGAFLAPGRGGVPGRTVPTGGSFPTFVSLCHVVTEW